MRMTVNDHSLRRKAVQKVFNVILNEVKNLILSLNREILLSLRSIRMTVIKLFGQPPSALSRSSFYKTFFTLSWLSKKGLSF